MLDKIYDQILNFKLTSKVPEKSRFAEYRFKQHFDNENWTVKNNKLYFKNSQNNILTVVKNSEVDSILEKLYNDPRTMLNGRDRFYARVSQDYAGITKVQVMNFLKRHETYQLHRPVYKQKVVRPIITTRPKQLFEIDLIDMSNEEYWNNGVHWLLTIIDVFSKFAYVIPLKNKEAETVADAIYPLLAKEHPTVIQSDRGSEFISDRFKEMMKELGITHRLSRSHTPESNGAIERFNGILKRSIYSYMTNYGTKQYTDVLDQLVLNYNTTKHGTTKFIPSEIKNASFHNKRIASNNIKKAAAKSITTDRRLFSSQSELIKVGDHVRIAKVFLDSKVRAAQRTGIGIQAKKYRVQWTRDLYKVLKVNRRSQGINTYQLEGIEETVPLDMIQLVNPDTLIKAPAMKSKLPEGVRNEEIFDREQHLKELHENRKGTKLVSLYNESEAVAKTKPKRNIKKPEKLNL